MAWLELDPRTGIYKIGIRLADGKFKRSLKTSNPREAKSLLGTVENTLTALERGWLTLPEGVDLADFLISGGKATGKLTRPQTLRLGQLFDQYFASIPDGSLETSTIKCMRIHERQLYRVLGKSLTVEKLTTAELQRFVDRRSKDKGLRGRPLTATTIKKAIVTLRIVWNWGIKHGGVNKSFPNLGIKYPKLAEKPHFQTRQEVEQRIARGGLSAAEQSDLWDCAFLNQALGAERFRRQIYRNLRIELWQKQRSYPRHHVTWNEGKTEVDVVITWENPETTVFIEMKYGSPLSATTVNNNGSTGFPADQLIRNARIGLWENGWFQEDLLFHPPPRDFVVILLTPTSGNPLVEEYRSPDRIRAAIPHGERLKQLPRLPFVGEMSYSSVIGILQRQRNWFSRPERMLIDELRDYLHFKLARLVSSNGQGQI